MANSRFGLRTRPGLVRSYTEGIGATDADATAFLNAAGITDATITAAIQQLVIDLKFYSVWTKSKAIWPFVGGTATTHKFNLKDPQDTDGAFRLVFTGGWTHSSNGALPNGTNGYAETYLNQSTQLSLNSVHLAMYSRTNSSVDSFDIGGNSGFSNFFGAQLACYYTGIGAISHLHSYPTDSAISSTETDTRAFYLASRTSSTSNKLYRNNTNLATNTTARTSTLYNGTFRLANDYGSKYTNRQFAFVSIGDGLTDTDASNLYTAVNAFQTTLGRQV
jgi:hypothetical protein